MNWKGTRGEWRIAFMPGSPQEEADFWVKSDKNEVVPYGTDIMQDDFGDHNGYPREQRMEDARLIADAGNTIQICDKMPSEILEERNELFGALLDLQAAQNGPPLEREKEYWQACMDRATKIINKIENGK